MGTGERPGRATEESCAELGSPTCPCLHYTLKWADSGSRGCGETARGCAVISFVTILSQAQSEPASALLEGSSSCIRRESKHQDY